jgi:hypothetical protein
MSMPSVPPEAGEVPPVLADSAVPPALLRAMQPPGALFALGWVMAALFDPRRRARVAERQPPFDSLVQLPLVADLEPLPKLRFLVAELTELTGYYPELALRVAAFAAEAAEKQPDTADEPSTGGYAAAALALNQAVLDLFADQPEPLNSYQLGLALSDMCWLPYLAKTGDAGTAGEPGAFLGIFARSQVAALKTLLSGAGAQVPAGAASMVSQSIDNWADWVDVNIGKITVPGGGWADTASVVLDALHVQGWVWHSVLTADPDVSVNPSMAAWVHAASAISRATRIMTLSVLRRFWWLAAIGLAVLGGLLYLVISNLSGVSAVWASLATVAAVGGGGGYGLSSGVSQSLSGVGYEIWSTAKQDAAAWNITWLPPVKSSVRARNKLAARGVAAPQLRTMDVK